MDNLTSLRDRIAAVLVDHAAAEYSWGVDGCECGFKASDLMEQAAHQADAVIEALSSWDVLMHILDYNYPKTVFPTLPDNPDRDPGPRIVSLLRTINEIRKSTDD